MWYIFGKSHGKGSMLLCIRYQFHSRLVHKKNKRHLSAVDQLEGIIEFCCDDLLAIDGSVSSMEVELSMDNLIGAADERHNKKASKITMQR
jgi:hypothetical protein